MPKVFLDTTMSVDGFTAEPDVSVKQPLDERGNQTEVILTGF